MRVLLVAPRSDLAYAYEEVQDVLRSGLNVIPMIGDVTSGELLREIKTGEFDVLWLATHGGSERGQYGVMLSDGFMSAGELVSQVRGRFSLVFLNSCTSFHAAQQIQEEANVSVVGTIIDVPDRQAYQTGSLFASWLASGLTAAQAYRRSKPGGARVYMYLASLEPSQDSLDNLLVMISELKRQIEQEVIWLRRLLWSSLILHGVEGLAIIWLWLRLMGG